MSSLAPKRELLTGQEEQIAITGEPTQAARDEEKMPLFLIKLWNIVEDPAYQAIVHWDESGYSFHIVDPYSFCRNVLPHYFKHNNLNSLIRQLNMYGFRKMTPLDRSGLTRAESDQDHLEFSHPYFVRDHPELLVNIKRKSSNRSDSSNTQATQSNISVVTDELRQLRDKQRNMDARMSQLVKENESMWEQISHMRTQHEKQRQVVAKLVHFIVSLVGPTQKHRIPKRGMLALDEPPTKRSRNSSSSQCCNNQVSALSDVLDNLQRQLSEGGLRNRGGGPIIADITEELSPRMGGNDSPHNNMNQQYGSSSSVNKKDEYGNERIEDIPGPSSQIDQWMNDPPLSQHSPSPNGLNPTLTLSPSIDMQWSNDLQEYLNNCEEGIDNCRDLLGRQTMQWNVDGDDFNGYQPGWIFDDIDNNERLALQDGEEAPHDNELVTPSTSPLIR